MSKNNPTHHIRRSLQSFAVNSYIFQHKISTTLDLYPTDLCAIHYLSQVDRLTTGALKERLALTSGATTALVDRLIALDYVIREADSVDRRRVYVRLNREKIKALKQLYKPINERVDRVFEKYTEKDLVIIEAFLNHITKG